MGKDNRNFYKEICSDYYNDPTTSCKKQDLAGPGATVAISQFLQHVMVQHSA